MYAFNQPLIPVWRSGDKLDVQLPFEERVRQMDLDPSAHPFPDSFSLISAQNAIISDLYRRGGQVEALVVNYDPTAAAALQIGEKQIPLAASPISILPVKLK